ncbi:pyridoxamine kinase [Clostridium sardiniense]|uniref:pyridoxamine kinase n=1 Tax=Clostridium sardiniense TaxID=29369 RepID=UPI003D3489A9
MNRQKRVAIINDLSGIGKCSLAVALPLLSVLNIEACPLPTAVLSNQTGFDEFSFYDLSDSMKDTLEIWQKSNEYFDAIYTGFLGSEEQIEMIEKLIRFNNKAIVIVDPVMGDNGNMYDTYTVSLCNKIKELVCMADIITPNITEAIILAENNFKEININNIDINKVKSIAKSLSKLGPSYVVITGVIIDNSIFNILYSKDTDEFHLEKSTYHNCSYSGTGDIFTSLISGYILKGINIKVAMKKASKFISKAIDKTMNVSTDPRYGIQFEGILKEVLLDEL